VKLAAGMIATVSALVLGLLVASAKTTFDTTEAEMTQRSAKILLLDRILADYGPETRVAREQLFKAVATLVETIWPEEKSAASGLTALRADAWNGRRANDVAENHADDEAQHQMYTTAQNLIEQLRESRWLLIEQGQNVIPLPSW
jgi:hypothetical protein